MSRVAWVLVWAVLATPVAGDDAVRGTWESKLLLFRESVRFDLRTETGQRFSITVDPDETDGLDRADLKTTGKTLSFGWARDAATVRFRGEGRWLGRPSGTFVLEPDPEYAEALGAVGCPRPSGRDLLRLVLHDVPADTVSALALAGYDDVDIEDLVRLRAYGVDGAYVDGMQQLGYRPSVDDLLRLRSHGVGPAVAGELARLDLGGIPADDLIRFRSHGVVPAWLREMADAGVAPGRVDDLVRLRSHGIAPAWVQGMADAGVAPERVDDLLRLRSHGLDPATVAAMRAVEAFDASIDDVLTLRSHGVDADYLAGLFGEAASTLTVEDVCRMRSHGVAPARYRALARLGYAEADAVVTLVSHGIDPADVEQLADLGYDGLDVADLVRLRSHGVDAAFVRRLIEAGYEELGVDRLIDARTRGVRETLGDAPSPSGDA